jgi:hypothetical protein
MELLSLKCSVSVLEKRSMAVGIRCSYHAAHSTGGLSVGVLPLWTSHRVCLFVLFRSRPDDPGADSSRLIEANDLFIILVCLFTS